MGWKNLSLGSLFNNGENIADSTTDNAHNLMQAQLGKNLLKGIEVLESMNKKYPHNVAAKTQSEPALKFMKTVAIKDIQTLAKLQNNIIKMYLFCFNPVLKKFLIEKIIPKFDSLISAHAHKLEKLHCPVQISKGISIKNTVIDEFCDSVIEQITNRNYDFAQMLILTHNFYFDSHTQAEAFFLKAHEAAQKRPKEAKYFLSVLEIRLFSPNHKNSQLIDYSAIEKNAIFKESDVMITTNNMDNFMANSLLEDSMSLYDYLYEDGLKKQYRKIIISEMEGLVNLAERESKSPDDL